MKTSQQSHWARPHLFIVVVITGVIGLSGCTSTRDHAGKPEKGPHGTIAYLVEIEASEPGVRIEADQEYIGMTPCTVKIFGDKDGTFHNFGQSEYVLKAYPTKEGQSIQTKTFRTGWWFGKEDRIPKRIYFDMNERAAVPGVFTVDLPEPKTTEP
jgi:hypothetical protein